MRHTLLSVAALLSAASAQQPVSTESLLVECIDLMRLCRTAADGAAADYRLEQWSSFDRRSRGPEEPGWFGNADGFGGEPEPGFAAVLRAPGADGVGLYLLGEVEGPGAIVRTWTAGMDGVLRVHLDGAEEPLFEGPAREFLARRTPWALARSGLGDGPGGSLVQQDADYLPVPFARGLRITWEGNLRELHFYHVAVRRYRPGTVVESFRGDGLAALADRLRAVDSALAGEAPPVEGATSHGVPDGVVLEPGATTVVEGTKPGAGGGAIVRLSLAVESDDAIAALRGIVLQIAFDGSERPQVEAPVGDFFGSGPGCNPFASLPMTVHPDGRMECRFPMPFAESWKLTLRNWSRATARVTPVVEVVPYRFDERTMWFRARWRIDHDLTAEGGAGPIDLPWVTLRGKGRLVGAACQIVNPSGIPTPGGNWWGEGDEKVLVDDAPYPVLFGTGSEDYFNYSWSRPDLFAHGYCGQPLDSGPGTSGFVSNHRFHVVDDVPFDRFLAFAMELWTHRRVERLAYGRIVWLYARPGAFDDHRALGPSDVRRPYLPVREPVADGGASGATLHDARELQPRVGDQPVGTLEEPLATRHVVVHWDAAAGAALRLDLPVGTDGAFDVNVVAVHGPDGAVVRPTLGGQPLPVDGAAGALLDLRTEHATRVLSRRLSTGVLPAGVHELVLECVEPGAVGLDYLWVLRRYVKVPHLHEGEEMAVVAHSPGTEAVRQRLRGAWSMGEHLWVKAREAGAFVELEARVAPGRYRARLHLTDSWDYGVLAVAIDGKTVVPSVATWSAELAPHAPLDLGEVETDGRVRLRLEVVERHPQARAPGTYFGVDGLALEPIE